MECRTSDNRSKSPKACEKPIAEIYKVDMPSERQKHTERQNTHQWRNKAPGLNLDSAEGKIYTAREEREKEKHR